ncbi:MAG: PorV/PorQ family protein [Candidatus Cryptobacteroides sp.]
MKIRTILLLAALCAGSLAGAQTFPSLLIGGDAFGVANGSAAVAKAEGAFAIDGNVAAMSLSDNLLDASVAFGLWQPSFSGDKLVSAGVRCKVYKGFSLGISFRDRIQNPYDITTSTGSASKDGSFTPKEYNLALGASYAFLHGLSAGVSLRFLRSALAPEASAMSFGADLAFAFSRTFGRHGASAGLSVNNLGTKLKYGENSYSLPALVKIGAAYDYILDEKSSRVGVSAEFDALFKGGMMAGIGAEYTFREMLFVRAGYHYGDRAKAVPSYASAGIGVKFYGVSLDASYIFASETLGNSFGVSLGYSF